MKDRGLWFSTLWIVVMFNMLAADILTFMVPGVLPQLMAGHAEGTPITLGFLLVCAILMEIPIAMIFLSRVLKHGANRLANIVASVITAAFVIIGGSNTPHYVFFAAMEVVCMLMIAWSAWNWRSPEVDVKAR